MNEVNEALAELYRYKTWATLRLIEACQGLSAAQLDATTPGTYGTIRDTLQHLVAADESYLGTVTGQRPEEPLPDTPVPLAVLADRMRELGPRWEALAADPAAASRLITTRDGWRTPAAIPMAQAIQHADEHRGQVLSILGGCGIETPGLDIGEDLDVWHHGIETGLMVRVDKGG
jgi:uncharacterized damage-inducible protein DinB